MATPADSGQHKVAVRRNIEYVYDRMPTAKVDFGVGQMTTSKVAWLDLLRKVPPEELMDAGFKLDDTASDVDHKSDSDGSPTQPLRVATVRPKAQARKKRPPAKSMPRSVKEKAPHPDSQASDRFSHLLAGVAGLLTGLAVYFIFTSPW